ncbi:MAG: hypothetical protein ACI89X_003388 [Planctomycetota bacterium]|jgi:hypothetical protein
MTDPELDYDDDATFDAWCLALRSEIGVYLKSEGYEHGKILDWPAWNVAPHVAMWAIESPTQPGYVGAWVLCGNLPMDYIAGDDLKSPREAMTAIAARWQELIDNLRVGKPTDGVVIESDGAPEQTVAMMESRVSVLRELIDDEEAWIADPAGDEND